MLMSPAKKLTCLIAKSLTIWNIWNLWNIWWWNLFNFYIKYFSIWITFAKIFTCFLKFIPFRTTKEIPPPSWPFLAWCNATYFGVWNNELCFAVSSASISVKTITLNFSFKRNRKSFDLYILLFRILIFKWNVENISLFSFSQILGVF